MLRSEQAKDLADYNKKVAKNKRLPRIVIVFDEFGESLTAASRELRSALESNMVRIGQLARASGIHLIAATQRPSVDTVTGSLKANLPSRIAFQLKTEPDSRTILGHGGAESLPQMGALLYSSGGSKLLRAQGAFIDAEAGEIASIINASRGTANG